MKHVFLFLSMFFLFIFIGNAQETTIKHTVEKGETVFQLSRKYNVTPEEIYALNPSAVDIIKIGEVLSIPKSQGQSQPNSISSSNSSSTSNTITYAVVYGDTKYSLARRFGISVEELERQNPHTRNGLQAGHILKIEGQRKAATSNNINIVKTHLVLKGQTLWGISKNNGLTVEQLVNANSDILSGILQIGQLLQIPAPYTNNTGETYLVQRGDTKYGLSKKYAVTISQLEEKNPHIIPMLMAGHTIQIPKDQSLVENEVIETSIPEKTEVGSVEEKVEDARKEIDSITTDTLPIIREVVAEQTNNTEINEPLNAPTYEDYEIKAQETLYGLSKKAGMAISEFVELNPQLSEGVKIGMMIKMPTSISIQKPAVAETITEPLVEKTNQKYVDLSQSIQTEKRNQILLFLPFSESRFDSDYQQNISFKEVSDEFIRAHLEFYRGAKIAQNSAKALGLDFNVQVVETNTSERNTKVTEVAITNSAKNYDAIILPFYDNDIKELATFVEDENIPVLTAGTVVLDQGNKNVYSSVPSLNTKRNVMLDYMKSKNANLIVVCDIARKESKDYISEYAPNTKFIEVSKKGNFNSDELISHLDSSKLNYVILESDKNSVFLSTTNLLFSQLSTYSIQLALLDKSLIPDGDDVSKKRFIILQMVYPSLTPLENPVIASNFIDSYKRIYSIEPTQNVKYGFDLTFDTLLRISQEKSFEDSAKSDISEYTTLKFDYKTNKWGGHDNNGIYIIQYNSDGTLKELK